MAYGYDAANRLNAVTSPAGTFSDEYLGGVDASASSAAARVRKLTLGNGAVITNQFDNGGLSGVTGGAGAVGGVCWGVAGGAVAGGTSAGMSTGGDPTAIGIGAVAGGGFGGLGAAASGLDPFAEYLFYGTSEVIGQDVGGYMNFFK